MQTKASGPTSGWLIKVALLDLVAALCLYLYGRSEHWDNLHLYGRGFVYVGIGLLAFGVFTIIGSARASTEEHYLYTHAVLNEHSQEHRSSSDLPTDSSSLSVSSLTPSADSDQAPTLPQRPIRQEEVHHD